MFTGQTFCHAFGLERGLSRTTTRRADDSLPFASLLRETRSDRHTSSRRGPDFKSLVNDTRSVPPCETPTLPESVRFRPSSSGEVARPQACPCSSLHCSRHQNRFDAPRNSRSVQRFAGIASLAQITTCDWLETRKTRHAPRESGGHPITALRLVHAIFSQTFKNVGKSSSPPFLSHSYSRQTRESTSVAPLWVLFRRVGADSTISRIVT